MSDDKKLTSREAIKLIKSWRRRIKPDWIDFDDILARVTDEPDEPEEVEPVDWPTEAGLWARNGDTYFVRGGNQNVQIFHTGSWWRKDQCLTLQGSWVKCTVTVPPMAEPVPEKPELLLARVTMSVDNGDTPPDEYVEKWRWLTPGEGYWWDVHTFVCPPVIHEVDRDRSDPKALWIYDREQEDREVCPR